MWFALDALSTAVPAVQIDEARAFYAARPRPAGRGPSTLEQLHELRDRGVADGFVGAALQFGTYDLSAQTPAGRRIADEYFLEAYLGHVADRTLPDVSPVFGDLRGLPPVLLTLGRADVLLEDNLAMAARFSAAGNEVDLPVRLCST